MSEVIDGQLYFERNKDCDIYREAYLSGGAAGMEYLKEIGKTDLTQMTYDEALTFLQCVCNQFENSRVANESLVREYINRDASAVLTDNASV